MQLENRVGDEKSLLTEQMKEIAHVNFKKWNNALQTGDPKIVAELYATNNTFLPTMSGKFEGGGTCSTRIFYSFFRKASDRGNY